MTRGCQLSLKAVLAQFEHKVTFFMGISAKPAQKICKTRLPQNNEADGALAQRGHEVLKSPALCAEKTLQEMHWGNQKEKHSIPGR